ncbi:MAG: adenylate/guanylate cyclase domain-containing protein [Bacteroidota bacterium]
MQTLRNVLVFFLLLSLYSCSQIKRNPPVVERGILDLTSWDLQTDGNVSLDGDWEFYNNRLLTSQDFKQAHPDPELLQVPGIWNELNKDREHPGYGYGTYRLRIKLNHPYRELGLKVFGAASSYKLWVGGEQIAENGLVSTNLAEMKPQSLPLTRNFHSDSTEVEIVVQVANNFHATGGLWDYLTIGTDEQIANTYDLVKFYDLFLIGVMFILFVYNMGIYLFRNSEKAALWFALTCLALMLRSLIAGERYLYVLLPHLDVQFGLRLEYLQLCVSGSLYALFLYHVFPEDFPKKMLRFITWVNSLNMLIVLVSPTLFYTSCLVYFQCFLILQCIYQFGIILPKTVIRKRQGSIPLLIGLAFLTLCVVNDILSSNMIIHSPYLISFGFFVTVLAQSFILASRFSKAFGTIEVLSIELTGANKNLEQKVMERTHQLSVEKQKSDTLLHNILPEEVAEELKQTGETIAKQYNHVTVLFTDFVGFTKISEQLSPKELVAEIHKNFTAFDTIIEKNGLEKIKTIGDAYLAVCGLPNESADHAQRVIRAAQEICAYMENSKFKVRVGINSGAVVAGIVGVKKFAYDIWGDTVNMASRMESGSEAGRINISGATYKLVKDEFTCEYRGKIIAKNKGEVDMYFVLA